MANIKITELPAASSTTGADVFPIVQSDTTKKAALSLLPVSTATQTALDAKVDDSQLGQPSGVATLDSGGKLTSAQIPDIAVSEYLGAVANQAAMLALTGQRGDWCSRTDLGTNWIITGSDPTQIGSWTQLSYPTAPVISVNGEVGAVVLDKSDIGLGNVTNAAQVTSVTGTAPIVSSGGTTPAISISAATTSEAGSMSSADKSKLDGIESGAQVNVNADWNASSGDAQILNKPTSLTPTAHAASHQVAVKATFSGSVTGMTFPIELRAAAFGVAGNSIVLTFNGSQLINDRISAWNAANPSNGIVFVTGNGQQTPINGQTIAFSGGAESGSDVFLHSNAHYPSGGDPIYDQELNSNSQVGFASVSTNSLAANSVDFSAAGPSQLFPVQQTLQLVDQASDIRGIFDVQNDVLTENRTYFLPNASGTLALSDQPLNTTDNVIFNDITGGLVTANSLQVLNPVAGSSFPFVNEIRVVDGGSDNYADLVAYNNLTDNRTYQLPNASGTLALSDQSLNTNDDVTFNSVGADLITDETGAVIINTDSRVIYDGSGTEASDIVFGFGDGVLETALPISFSNDNGQAAANAATTRDNLGLGTADAVTFESLEVINPNGSATVTLIDGTTNASGQLLVYDDGGNTAFEFAVGGNALFGVSELFSVLSVPLAFQNPNDAETTRANLGLGAADDVTFHSVSATDNSGTLKMDGNGLIWEGNRRWDLETSSFLDSQGAQMLELTSEDAIKCHLAIEMVGDNAATNAETTRTNLGLGAEDAVTFTDVNASNLISIGEGGAVDFGSAGSITLPPIQTSLAIFENGNEITGTFRAEADSLTANRTYDLPDASGILLLDTLLRTTATAPSTITSSGIAGEIRASSDFIYVCVATNSWKRAALTGW